MIWILSFEHELKEKPTVVWACEYTLHGMVCSVTSVGGSCFIASSAQIIVIAYQAFEPQTSEIAFDAWITANT